MPQIADLSRYMLKVTDLADGQYAVSMNGKPVAPSIGSIKVVDEAVWRHYWDTGSSL